MFEKVLTIMQHYLNKQSIITLLTDREHAAQLQQTGWKISISEDLLVHKHSHQTDLLQEEIASSLTQRQALLSTFQDRLHPSWRGSRTGNKVCAAHHFRTWLFKSSSCLLSYLQDTCLIPLSVWHVDGHASTAIAIQSQDCEVLCTCICLLKAPGKDGEVRAVV